MKRYEISKDLVLREDKKEKWVFNIDRGDILKINDAGFLILKTCQNKSSELEILEALKKSYPKEDIKKLSKDTKKFLKKLVKLKLIKVF